MKVEIRKPKINGYKKLYNPRPEGLRANVPDTCRPGLLLLNTRVNGVILTKTPEKPSSAGQGVGLLNGVKPAVAFPH
jgi:hypothetical protein